MEKIAVIVPVYKVEAYLERCVASICAQTYSDFDLVLVDDGSPDRCPRICDELAKKDHRIHVIHQVNGGLSAARNTGIEWTLKKSNCKWLTFVDSDDSIAPCFLSVMLQGAVKLGANISCCGFSRPKVGERFDPPIDEHSCVVFYANSPDWFYDACFNWKYQGIFVSNIACAKLFSIKCFSEIRFPVGVRAHEDVYTTYKLLFAEKCIAYTYGRLYRYQITPSSILGVEWSPVRMHQFYAEREKLAYFKLNNYKYALAAETAWHFGRIFALLDTLKTGNKFVDQIAELRRMLVADFAKYGTVANNLLALCPRVFRELSPRSWWRRKFANVRFKVSRVIGKVALLVCPRVGVRDIGGHLEL